MRTLVAILGFVLLAVACEVDVDFTCRVVETEATNITEDGVTLEAVVSATDYSAIERMGFAVAVAGSEEYDMYPAERGRVIEVDIDDLRPSTNYTYRIFVMAMGDTWNLEGGSFKTLNVKEEPEPTPDPNPTPEPISGSTFRAGWFELPAEVDEDEDGRDDNNSTYYYAHHVCGGGERNAQGLASARNYSVCFSSEHHCPVWVAAPRHAMYSGSAKRTDAYQHDPQIPADIQYVRKDADSGCNNGHMLGSAERTSSSETNRQVFYFSNIAPQYSNTFNTGGGAWNNLEDHIDDLVCRDTLYTVIGCYFDTYTDKYGNTGTPKKISFGGRSDVSRPTMFYYALLRTKSGNTGKSVAECSASELQCAAFVMSHEQAKGHKPEARDIISIEELEEITGFTYFDNVPNAPKSTFNSSDWL